MRRAMKKFLLAAMVSGGLVWGLLLVSGRTSIPVPRAADPPEAIVLDLVKQHAWQRALDLAQATPEERAKFALPSTRIILKPRYIPGPFMLPNRLCGQTELAYAEPDAQGRDKVAFVEAYVRPQETELRDMVLTHEYLHAIWYFRIFTVNGWLDANPDSEAYVVSLIQNTCPVL